MEFRVLGPLSVVADGVETPLRSAKQRVLLAMLLAHANTPVSPHRLMEALWEVPPASAAENLRLYVHQLRKALDLGDRVSRPPTGYALTVHDGELDADRFTDLMNDALTAGDPAKTGELLTEALGLWRGPAYADLAETPAIRQVAVRLDEARLRAIEERVAAELALGRHAEVVGELIGLTDAHPYREPLRAKLMVALYGSGRQAEALETYRRTRELLVADLGIEPGPELRGLHATMLHGEQVEPVAVSAPPHGDCPYRGLMAYQPEHHAWFFGRDHLVELLTRRVDRYPVVGVFGASGSGKSSLLRAGLLGGLGTRWRPVLLTPTARPMAALAAALAELTGREVALDDPAQCDIAVRTWLARGPDDVRVLLVVDQFEELFTLCADEDERAAFVRTLLDAALGPRRRTTVVLGVRADFLAHVTQHAELVAALADEATVLVGPPNTADLRDIVLRPAAMTGLSVAADLLATVLADVDAEPGALPLLSHALVETWGRRGGHELTLADYRAGGGVRGAIAQTAEREYEELGEDAVRRIFLRLTAFGDGTDDTRRPVRRAELDGVVAPAVLDSLARARLIVLDADTVEIAHEALIRAWPRLQRWLSDDRAALLAHRRLTVAAQTWVELDRDEGALFRGTQLASAPNAELNAVEQEFLLASREREESEQVSARRRTRLLARLVAIMSVLLLLAVAAGGAAWWQSSQAQLRQRVDQAHRIALTARQLLDTAPDLGGLLAVAAYRLHADDDTRGALLSSSSAPRRRVELNTGGPPVLDVEVSGKGDVIATADRDGIVTLWDPVSRDRKLTLTDHNGLTEGGYARQVAFSADDRRLASSASKPALNGTPGDVVIWDLASGKPVFQQRFDLLTVGMALHPNGSVFAVGVGGGRVELWDADAGTHRVLTGHQKEVNTLAFSPDGKLLVTANGKEHPVVWDTATGAKLGTVPVEEVNTVAFGTTLSVSTLRHGVSFWDVGATVTRVGELPRQGPYAWDASAPAGDRMAVSDEDGLITIWDIHRARPVTTYRDRGRTEARALVLGRGGTMLVSGGLGGTVAVRHDAVPPFTGHADGVNDVDISGATVASAGDDGTVRLWSLDGTALSVLDGHPDRVQAVAFNPDGTRLAAVTRNHVVTVWDVATRQRVTTFPYTGLGASTDIAYQPDGRGLVTASLGRFRWTLPDLTPQPLSGGPLIASRVEFTPDGKLLISTDPAGSALVWDMTADQKVHKVSTRHGDVRDVAVSPDGRTFATAGADRTVKVWDTASGAEIMTLTGHTAPPSALAFSPSGGLLASAGEDHTIVVWNLATRTGTTLTGHTGPVRALAFTSEDGLLSGADDSRVIRWSLTPDAALTKICTEIGRDLTPPERATHAPDTPPVCR